MSAEKYLKARDSGAKQYFPVDGIHSHETALKARKVKLENGVKGIEVMATRTFEFRPPKKGEWYLSGALITAYRAPNDLGTPYHIAKLVVVKKERKVTCTEITDL